MKKVYIVRKYILAKSVKEAIRLEKKREVDDCWAEEKSLSTFIENITPKVVENPVGFKNKPLKK